MRKRWIPIAVIAVLLLFIGAVFAVRLWFESEGVRTFGGDLHAELAGKCYIIDHKTGEIIDETTVYINGSTSSSDEMLFDGTLNVVGYQNTETGTIESTMGVEEGKHGYWMVQHLQSCTHRETVDGITKDVEHICDRQYFYYLNPELGQEVVVRIESLTDDPLYAVSAETEKEALARYHSFIKNHP